MKNIFIVSYAYIAAVIGAGFASGQEILCYFGRFGRNGFAGVVISSASFALFAAVILLTCRKADIHGFADFTALLPGRHTARALRLLTGIFSFAGLTVMLSAFGVSCSYAAGIPGRISSLVAAFGCFFLLYRRPSGITGFNGILGIFLALGIAFCCFYILRYREYHVFSSSHRVAGNALIYSGYNLITVLPVLVIMSARLKSAAEAAASAFISGLVLFILMSLIFGILSIYAGRISLGEFPMLTMAYRQSTALAAFYGILLTASVLTTLAASAEAVSESFTLRNKPLLSAAASAAAYFLSSLGFGRLVDTAYRICGIIGFALCALVSVFCIKLMIKKDFKRLYTKIEE